MVYNEQQLESFCKPASKYEHEKIIATYHAIREAMRLVFEEKKRFHQFAP